MFDRFPDRRDMSRSWLAILLTGAMMAVAGDRSIAAPPVKDAKPKTAATVLPPAAARKIDFVRDIRPIFQRSCYRCHGPEKQKNGYRLDVRNIAMTEGRCLCAEYLAGQSGR